MRSIVSLLLAGALLGATGGPANADYNTYQPTATQAADETGTGRLAGENRYATSAKVAEAWPSGPAVAYVVSGRDFPDALAAASRAGKDRAPVLLSDPASLSTPTRGALERLRPNTIVVVGGSAAVSTKVLDQLRPLASSGTVRRVAGTDRYSTAAALAGQYQAGVDRVYLASGEDFPDALAGAALAGYQQAPMLLTDGRSLDPSSRAELARLRPDEIVILGGTTVVSDRVAQMASSAAATNAVSRLSGPDRYATAEKVAAQFPVDTSSVFVGSGETFPDALAGSALAGWRAAPMLLTKADVLPAPTARVLGRQRPDHIRILGGESAISDSVVAELSKAAATSEPGRVLFDANLAVSGLSKYGSVHNANRIKVVNDPGPLGASRKVLRFEVYESDNQLTGNPRAQAETPKIFKEGDEIWVGFSTYFPTGWPDQLPPGTGNFITFAEVYGAPYAGSAPVKIAMRAGQNKLTFQRNKTYSWDIPWEAGPIRKNAWHDWVIREKLSRDGKQGFVEIYRNTGTGWKIMPLFGVTRLYTQTIDSSNAVGPQYHKIALYYAAGMKLANPLVMYFADHKIATSFAAAAPRSYGAPPAGPPK